MVDPTATEATRSVDLTSSELELVVTALKLLRATLGREEAEELAEVMALLEKLRNVS
jgi:hypothetical protein